MILMLLFAQSLSSALPCQMPDQKPAMAFEDMSDMDCAQKGNPNGCLQQYTAADQSAGHVQVGVAEMPRLSGLVVPVAGCHAILRTAPAVCLAHSPDPPPSIRFCSFQI
jgi:hypothetical protein